MDKDSIQTAKSFTYRHGPKSIGTVEWTILPDDHAIDKCDMEEYAKKKKSETRDETADADGDVEDNNECVVNAGADIFPHPIKKDIGWDPDPSKVNYNRILFKHFLPDIGGKALVLDDYLFDPRCGFHQTVLHDKIQFHCPCDKDPDKLVSFFCGRCYYLMCQLY
jgi:hypothetical protein